MELLDNKCYMKLVDIAHSLLKMAPYDQVYSNYLIGKKTVKTQQLAILFEEKN